MHGPKYTPPKPLERGHKQGRFVTGPSGHAERPGGEKIDLHALLTEHKHSVDLVPIATNIMRASGLHAGGLAVVDRAMQPKRGLVMVVRFNGAVIIRRLDHKAGQWCFVADDPREHDLYITEADTVERLGVVVWAISKITK